MTPAPWAEPELTGPRPAADARRPPRRPPALDGTLAVPAAPRARRRRPAPTWGEIEVPGCWTMQGTWDRPHLHERADAVPGPPAGGPGGEPDRRLRARVRAARRLGGPPRRAPRRRRRERADRRSSTGRRSGSARTRTSPRSSTSRTVVRPARTPLRLTVVKWSDATFVEDQDQWWHGGITRSVFLYATGAGVPRGRRDRRRASRPTTPPGTLALEVGRRLAGRRTRGRAGRSRRGSRASRGPWRADVPHAPPPPGGPGDWVVPGPPRRGVARPRQPGAAGALTDPDDVERWRAGGARLAPAARGPVRLAARVPGVDAVVRGGAALYRLDGRRSSRPTAPSSSGSSGGSASGGSRSRTGAADQRPAGAHPRRQPPRLRPADRARGLAARTCAPTSC